MKVKNGVLKILFLLLVIFVMSSINMQPTYCDSSKSYGSGKFEADKYKPKNQTEVEHADKLLTSANKVIGIVMWIGIIISVTTFVTIGIKYMVGSVEEKAQYKKTLFPYLIGAILVFGITTIVKIISEVATNI